MVKRTAAVACVLCALAAGVLVAARMGVLPAPLQERARLLLKQPATIQEQNTSSSRHAAIESTLVVALRGLEVRPADLSVRAAHGDSSALVRARVPLGPPIEWVVWRIASALDETHYRITDCQLVKREWIITIASRSPAASVRLVLARATHFYSATARLAVVVEDFGFDTTRAAVEFLAFDQPVTFSVRQTGKRSTWTAQVASEYKKEIIVLLPMEPEFGLAAQRPDNMILVHYPEEKIKGILQRQMDEMPSFAGFTNLLGSRALADTRVTTIVLGEMKKRHAYFLESREGQRSVAAAVSRRLGVPYAACNTRIPKLATPQEIDDAIGQAVATAQSRGRFILGLPATPATIATLKKERSFLATNGIKLVFVSELVRD